MFSYFLIGGGGGGNYGLFIWKVKNNILHSKGFVLQLDARQGRKLFVSWKWCDILLFIFRSELYSERHER